MQSTNSERTRETFTKACRAVGLGNRLDIENYPDVPAFPVYEQTRTIAAELISSAHQHLPKLPPIHFDFLGEPEINAWAFRFERNYFIAVTAGAVTMLHLVLDRILASPHTFPAIGDPSLERRDVQPVPWNIINPEELYAQGIRPVVAQDKRRILYAGHIAEQALMFLVGHEIAHITRGHVDYLKAVAGESFLEELGWQGSNDQSIVRQVLEADADRRSILARCFSLFQTAKNNTGQTLPWTDNPVTVESMQFDWAFAVNVLFRLFGDKNFDGSNLEATAYPPMPLRRRMAMDYGGHLLLQNWGMEHEDKIKKLLVESIRVSENSFRAIDAPEPDGGFANALGEKATEHLRRLRERWDELKPNLASFAFEDI
jgi:hypothetical protein